LLNWSLISDWDPVMQALAALCALVLLARSAGFVVQWLLLRVLPRMRGTLVEMEWAQVLLHDSVLQRLAKAVPSLVMQSGVQAIPQLQPQWATG
jgi:miniconductance mechanosensitive channel